MILTQGLAFQCRYEDEILPLTDYLPQHLKARIQDRPGDSGVLSGSYALWDWSPSWPSLPIAG